MPNFAQLDIREAIHNNYVIEAPPVPPRMKPQNTVVYKEPPKPPTVYDNLMDFISLYTISRPRKIEHPKDLKSAIERNALTDPQQKFMNRFYLPEREETFLFKALEKGYYQFVQVLVGLKGIDVNKGDYQGKTPLMLACIKRRYASMVKLLLQHPDIDVNRLCKARLPTEMGRFHAAKTALHTAVHCANEHAVEALLNHPSIDLSVKDSYGKTAYMYAFENHQAPDEDRYDRIKSLFETKGVPRYDPRTDEPPGFRAVYRDLFSKIKRTDVCTDPNAIVESDKEVQDFLEKYKVSLNDSCPASWRYPLHFYKLPKAHNHIESCDETALTLSIRSGHFQATVALLKHPGVDVRKPILMNAYNYFSEYKFTIPNVSFPLMLAVSDLALMKLLLSHPDIDVNQKNVVGETALMRACAMHEVNAVKELLTIPHIDLNTKNFQGMTALMFGIEEMTIVRMILADKRFDKKLIRQACLYGAEDAPIPVLQTLLRSFEGTEREAKRLKRCMLQKVYQKGEGETAVQRSKWLHSLGASISNNAQRKDRRKNEHPFLNHVFQEACVNGDVELARHFLEEPYFSRYKVDLSEDTLYSWDDLGASRIDNLWRVAGFVRKPGFGSLLESVLEKNHKAIVILLTFGTPDYEKFLRFLELKEEQGGALEEEEELVEGGDLMDAVLPHRIHRMPLQAVAFGEEQPIQRAPARPVVEEETDTEEGEEEDELQEEDEEAEMERLELLRY